MYPHDQAMHSRLRSQDMKQSSIPERPWRVTILAKGESQQGIGAANGSLGQWDRGMSLPIFRQLSPDNNQGYNAALNLRITLHMPLCVAYETGGSHVHLLPESRGMQRSKHGMATNAEVGVDDSSVTGRRRSTTKTVENVLLPATHRLKDILGGLVA